MANLSNINGKFVVEQTTGFVGIGTTDPAYLLHVNSSDIPNGTRIIIENTNGSGKKYGLISDNTGVFTVRDITAGADRFSISTLGNATFAGNVGIGTASPQERLHIVGLDGSVPLSSYYGSLVVDNNGEAAMSIIGNSYSSIYFGDAATNFVGAINYQHSVNAMIFKTNDNTEKMRITSGGNVGIGRTAPDYKLVISNSNAEGIELGPGYASGNNLWQNYNRTTGAYVKETHYASTYAFLTAGGNTGNVGIGRSPVAYGSFKVLDLAGSSGAIQKIIHTGSTVELQSYASSTLGAVGTATNHSLLLTTNDTTALTIDSSQNATFSQNVTVGTTAASDFVLALRGGVGGFLGWDDSANKTILQAPNTRQLSLRVNSDTFGAGTEALLIDSSGNVGIANSNPSGNVVGENGKSLIVGNESAANESASISIISGSNGYSYLLFGDGDGASGYQGQVRYQHSLNNLQFVTGANERMRIDSSGNVGIGTTSPAEKLTVDGTVSGAYVRISNAGSGDVSSGYMIYNGSNLDFNVYTNPTFGNTTLLTREALAIRAGGSERMRITSGGEVLIGTGGNDPSSSQTGFSIQNNAGLCLVRQATSDTSANTCNQFINPNGVVGTIQTSGSSTSFNTSSDYRLKENVIEMTNALDRVSQLKPSRFNFIADADKTVDGFLAHEVQEIVPEAITGEKDAINEEGNAEYQGIDQSKLVPLLVGAIQELKAEIEILKNK
jgi:hypothetical protein